ncbi:carbon-nitrogen family hydrolase [Paenibacillus psychroresistens]|uniref:Carbon-nitrogen family hydrolase n=1 Tax=Paenibacillus psychroresistens TaxID=1778678 RepID=A0A6B8RLU6_9BACL|nr:carbon-nitrogen family hydrolase [Paenibacillus psychroresistens]QGQ96817.1 carbon-nitrogen family hydrolase [Paenibacillus psychroresistens]
MNQSNLTISLLQMDIEIGEPDRNFANLTLMLSKAIKADPKPDIIIFPEMWNTGYALEQIQQLADLEGERTKRFISQFCLEHDVNIIAGSIAEKKGDEVLNTVYVFNRQGELTADYSKIHLFRLMDEEKFLASGDQIGKIQIDEIPAGVMICYDIRFPELARKLALDGAKILFVPAEWPNPRLHHWRTLLMARAIENQMFVVACNRVGISGKAEFFGHSLIIDPWGEIIAEGSEEEEILTATLSMSDVDQVRARIPVFEDRRPEIYKL